MPDIHIVQFSSVHKTDDIRVFWKECRSLAAAGYRVTLIARGDESDVKEGVNRLAMKRPAPGGRLGRMIFGTARVTRLALQQKADFYHFHGPELILHGLFLKLLGKTVIYDAHENFRHQILQKHYLPKRVLRTIATAVGILEDFAVGRFDGVVAATPRIAKQLNTPHTISVTNYPILTDFELSRTASNGVPATLVYVGGVSVLRGIREMIQAIELVNHEIASRLIICGPIPPDLQREVEDMPGWKYVDALGWQERPQVLQWLAKSQIGLCVLHPAPNHVESIPNKLFEYMESGLPVVASHFPYWQQFVEDIGSGVMVDPLNPESIANGILEIMSDPDRASQMSKAGAEAVRERFNWDAEAAKLISLYDGLLKA